MGVHDWPRVRAGLFHNFHQSWAIRLMDALNDGVLPEGYYAMADQNIGGPIPDVLAYRQSRPSVPSGGGLASTAAPPRAWRSARTAIDAEIYAQRASRINVLDPAGRVVATVEIVSPGNKQGRKEYRAIVEKSADLLRKGVHLLVVDVFPPPRREPAGLACAVWEELGGAALDPLPAERPLMAAAFEAGAEATVYVEPFAVGDPLPSLPLFLEPGWYVPAPLEGSYAAAWKALPAVLKAEVEAPAAC